jgi:hypothetical protein
LSDISPKPSRRRDVTRQGKEFSSIFLWWGIGLDQQNWVGYMEGYRFHDFFADDGLARAEAADTIEEALAILRATYRGPNRDGIGVLWGFVGREGSG